MRDGVDLEVLIKLFSLSWVSGTAICIECHPGLEGVK